MILVNLIIDISMRSFPGPVTYDNHEQVEKEQKRSEIEASGDK
tara:strand:+ start:568 stop:696 length:129 start_codon:yes stop_codon:yes gene_type:complete